MAVDTNVLVRAFVEDGSDQFTRVARLMRECHIVILPTVLLETEWILRDVFDLQPDQIATVFETLLGISSVTVIRRDRVVRALAVFRAGGDFADSLHAALATEADVFATFDRDFAKRASSMDDLLPVQLVPKRGKFTMRGGIV